MEFEKSDFRSSRSPIDDAEWTDERVLRKSRSYVLSQTTLPIECWKTSNTTIVDHNPIDIDFHGSLK